MKRRRVYFCVVGERERVLERSMSKGIESSVAIRAGRRKTHS